MRRRLLLPISSILAFVGAAVISGCSDTPDPMSTGESSQTSARQSKALPHELNAVVQAVGRGRFEDARRMAEAYIEQHPEDGRGYFAVAYAWHSQGNHQPAVAHFETAVKLSPEFVTARHFFGECLFLLGELEAAREQHEAHLQLDRSEPDPLYGLGLIELEDGNLDGAERFFREAIVLYERIKESDPRVYQRRAAGRARCHARIADVHFARDDYVSARDELLTTVQISPGTISAMYTLSVVYRRLGEDDLADQTLRRYESAKADIIRRRQGRGG